ncbi:MAG: hypothetical protein OEW42_19965 [Acidimicrobiia bacterium]|nr:hypothetical protein [Acidimicrobiia bacterium]MDH5238841.1 hypothetical protein [Acidimicrobiia bacterium]
MLAGPVLMCALLLGVAGLAKLLAPTPTRAALYAMGLPSATAVVVVLGLAEVALAVTVFVLGGAGPAAGVAVAYAGFAGFVAWGRHTGRLTACGCFGEAGTQPHAVHVGFNVVAAIVGLAAVVAPVPAIDSVVADQPWFGLPFGGLVALGTFLSYAVLTALPAALAYGTPRSTTAPGAAR